MTDNNEEVIPGYLCACGFTTDDKTKFLAHVGGMSSKEGSDKHHTKGKINLLNGDLIMPPSKDRTPDQIYESKYHKKRPSPLTTDSSPDVLSQEVNSGKANKGNGASNKPVTGTNVLSQATQLRFIPRVFTCNLTPIMLLGYEVAIRKWNWRPDMPFENFLDTIIYNYMREHGIQLQGAITIFDDTEEATEELQPA